MKVLEYCTLGRITDQHQLNSCSAVASRYLGNYFCFALEVLHSTNLSYYSVGLSKESNTKTARHSIYEVLQKYPV